MLHQAGTMIDATIDRSIEYMFAEDAAHGPGFCDHHGHVHGDNERNIQLEILHQWAGIDVPVERRQLALAGPTAWPAWPPRPRETT